MAWRPVVLGLLLCGAVGAVVWARWPDPCDAPVAYRLARVDERFGLSREDAAAALREAEAVWRRVAGRDLFVERPGAPLAVNLVYDERQQTTDGSLRMLRALDQARDAHAKIARAYAFSRRTWEGRARDYQDAQEAYRRGIEDHEAQVREWNRRGGAPDDVVARLEAERARLAAQRRELDAHRAALEELGASVRGLADRGNAVAAAHQRDASTFNERYGGPRRFHQGEFDGREIAVFEFRDMRELVLVLAHELGHARGLGHVDDPTAIMHAEGSRQDLSAWPVAAPADLRELHRACPR